MTYSTPALSRTLIIPLLAAALLGSSVAGASMPGAAQVADQSAAAGFDQSVSSLFAEVESLLAEMTARFDAVRDESSSSATPATPRMTVQRATVAAPVPLKSAAIAAAEQRHTAAVAAAALRATREQAATKARYEQAQAKVEADFQRLMAELGTRPVSSFRRIPGGYAGEQARVQARLAEEETAAAAAIERRQQQAVNASAAEHAAAVDRVGRVGDTELAALLAGYQAAAAQAAEQAARELELAREQLGDAVEVGPAPTPAPAPEPTPVPAPKPAPPAPVPQTPEERDLSRQLTWTIPAQRVNGAPLTMAELSGYELYYAAVDSERTGTITISVPGQTSYDVGSLAAGRYVFAIAAVDGGGLKSDLSPPVEVMVP